MNKNTRRGRSRAGGLVGMASGNGRLEITRLRKKAQPRRRESLEKKNAVRVRLALLDGLRRQDACRHKAARWNGFAPSVQARGTSGNAARLAKGTERRPPREWAQAAWAGVT